MKEKYRIAIAESQPYIVVLIVIGLAVYLNSLIVVDNITVDVAQIIGYTLLTILIGFEIYSLILLKVKEVEKAELTSQIRLKDNTIEDLERDLDRLKNKG